MQKRKISFNKEGSFGTNSPHPKRENPHYNKHIKVPLAEKQHAQQFMQSYFNINTLMSDTFSFENSKSIQKNEDFPLANHLSGYYSGKKLLENIKNHKLETVNQKTNRNETANKTQHTHIDQQESQYQNYLKQYETVVKNSRSKEFVSPMAHKKQIDDLITEFLSDMQDSDVKSAELSPKYVKIVENPTNLKVSRLEKQEKARNPTSDVVKVQKIDLTELKANSYHNSYSKSNKKDNKRQKQISIKKQNLKINKKPQTIKKVQIGYSKNAQIENNQKKKYDTGQYGNKVKNRQKSKDKVKIETIKIQDLRKAKSNEGQKQLKYSRKVECVDNRQKNHQLIQAEKNSYLKQNLYKISKVEQKYVPPLKNQAQSQQTCIKNEFEMQGKRPLKIQIQISQEFQDEEPKIEPIPQLQEQKYQIIRLISKKVSNMIHDTKKIALNRGK